MLLFFVTPCLVVTAQEWISIKKNKQKQVFIWITIVINICTYHSLQCCTVKCFASHFFFFAFSVILFFLMCKGPKKSLSKSYIRWLEWQESNKTPLEVKQETENLNDKNILNHVIWSWNPLIHEQKPNISKIDKVSTCELKSWRLQSQKKIISALLPGSCATFEVDPSASQKSKSTTGVDESSVLNWWFYVKIELIFMNLLFFHFCRRLKD